MNKNQLNTLLIDDDERDYNSTRDMLAQLKGWEVNLEWVSSYEAALSKLERGPYDICLLDCCIGDHNGLDFLNQATKNGNRPSLILLTESDDDNIAHEGLEAGAVDYLVKGQMDARLLERSLRYAVKHKTLVDSLETQVKTRTTNLTQANEQLQQEIIHYKQREEVLKQEEQQYRMFFNIDIYAVEVLDKEGNIVDCNPRYEHLLGYSRDEIIGKHVTTFTTDHSTKAFQKMLKEIQKQGYSEGEREIVHKDGSTLLVWSRSRALHHASGEFSGIVTFKRDITERMKAVKQISTLARALEQSPVALMITDADGIIEYTNFEFTELTGYTYEEIIGMNMHELPRGDQSPENYQAFEDAVSTAEEWEGELHNLRQDGEAYWTLATLAPMFDAKGKVTHFIIIHEDITNRKEEESETLRAQRRIGDLMTEQISDLTSANEEFQREIDERIRMHEALEQSRARFEAQYKGIPVPTYTWEIQADDFVLVDYNHAAEESSQIAQFKGKKAGEIFKDRPQVLGDFLRCSIEKTIVKREAPYTMITTGQTRYYVTTYNFVAPNLIIVHIQDVTEYKQLEEEWASFREQLDTSALEDTGSSQVKEALTKEVAKREQLEQLLQEAEKRLKEVASNIDERLREQYRSIPIPTYTWQRIGGEFILVDFNDAAAESMGRIVDFFGKPASEIFENRPQILADFTECYEEQKTLVREAPYKMITTGETRYFVTTYNFVAPNLVVDHIEDITTQKQMEEELEKCRQQLAGQASPQALEAPENEGTPQLTKKLEELKQELAKHERAAKTLRQNRARLKAQYNGIPIPTYSWQRVGDDFVLVDYNNAAEKSTNGRIVDFMGKPVGEVFKERREVLADFFRCFNEKRTIRRESHYQLLTADETKYFVTTYNFVPPNLVVVYIEDITEHKQIENLLRRGEEQVDLICRLSPQATLTYVNDAYCWYFNQSREKLIGKPTSFVHKDDQQQVKMHLASLRTENPVGTVEYRIVKPNGDVRWQQWIHQTTFDDQGRLVEIQAVGRDITSRKEKA